MNQLGITEIDDESARYHRGITVSIMNRELRDSVGSCLLYLIDINCAIILSLHIHLYMFLW